jgi:hypothetical protein
MPTTRSRKCVCQTHDFQWHDKIVLVSMCTSPASISGKLLFHNGRAKLAVWRNRIPLELY